MKKKQNNNNYKAKFHNKIKNKGRNNNMKMILIKSNNNI